MATTVLCSTIGPSAPSYPAHVQLVHPFQGGDERLMHHDRPLSAIVSRFTVRLAHSLQDGDDRLMQYDRPLSAIVPSSCSARPSLPGWRQTSYASRLAPQRHRVQIHGLARPFPSRMATTVLCSTIGPSAPSYPAHVQLVHPFQGGDERLMHHDRPLSAIVSRFTVRLAHSLQDGDDRLMQYDRPLSAIVPSSRSVRPSLPGWRRTSYASRSALSAVMSRLTVRLAHSLQDGDDRLMQYDRPLSAIVPSSRSARPSLPGWRRTSYASRSAPQRHRVQTHGSARPFPPGWR
ncbi:unnamed protein product [Cuscuta epithymum]|uniref:Uncharacterized protein n=1 Tax=Cuscuta epithymum TaxID=186058 RepID=A0AAV0G9C0_9ASTE|nr:unnamed protein product [Cuscuta epithymum]